MALEREVSMGFVSSSDSRKPRRVLLQVEDPETNTIVTRMLLSEHQFVALLSGAHIRVEAEI